jgi:flagellar motor switch protein FliN/FliY
MATKKTPKSSDASLDLPGNEAELEQAIDGLRGVLKQDADGELPDFGGGLPDFGGDFGETGASETTSLSTFGDFGDDDAGSSAFDVDSFASGGMGGFDSPATSAASAPSAGSALTANLDLIMDIPIDVQIVLGSSRMQVSGLMNLAEGAIIALDKKIGEPVEITVNGRRIARGEITVLENDDTRFGVKLIEVLKPTKA